MSNKKFIKCFKRVLLSRSASKNKSLNKIDAIEEIQIENADYSNGPNMIDITNKLVNQSNNNNKKSTVRSATAEAIIKIDNELKQKLCSSNFVDWKLKDSDSSQWSLNDINLSLNGISELITAKGDVFTISRLAGIQGAKQTSNIIPLCHQIPLSHVSLDIQFDYGKIRVQSNTKAVGQVTGVEMEALTAVSVAALTIYDMLKSLKMGSIVIEKIELLEKHGGSTGSYVKSNSVLELEKKPN